MKQKEKNSLWKHQTQNLWAAVMLKVARIFFNANTDCSQMLLEIEADLPSEN